MKNVLFTFVLLFGFLSFAQGGSPGAGMGPEITRYKIDANKSKVEKKAKEFVSEIILDYCRHGHEYLKTELYRGGTYKIHFRTGCSQYIEVHYYGESGDFKKWFIIDE